MRALALALVVCAAPLAHADPASRILRVSGYDFALPSWWDSVAVEVPPLANEDAIRDFVTRTCGKDTGTLDTWKRALKIWAIASARVNVFPVYIGHAYLAGQKYREAARVFTELWALAGTRGKDAEWFRAFLPYNAGEAYRKGHDREHAIAWYKISASFAGSSDSAVRYYAEESRKLAERVRAGDFSDPH